MASCIVPSALDSLPTRREKLQKSFSELHAQASLLTNCTTEWKDLEDYIAQVEQTIQTKLQELSHKEKELETKVKESKESLDQREEAISVREQASLSRVQEQKDAALAAILEEKRKWTEERQGKAGNLGVLEGLAMKAHSTSTIAAVPGPKSGAADANGTVTRTGTKERVIEQAKDASSEVRVRPSLKSLCENMDGEGLRKFITDHRKDTPAFRNELPSALQSAIDPSRLVLKAVEGCNFPVLDSSQAKETGASADSRACILLLESLSQVVADPILGVEHPVVPSNIKDSAKEVANRWRSKMDIQGDVANVNAFSAQAFLQLLATFGIASEFNDDELCKLVTVISRRKQTPDLCRSLGLSAKIPGLVDKLAKGRKQMEALSFAHAFGIMDRVQPVSLLKEFLKEAREAAQALAKNAPTAAAGQNDSMAKELSALKAVLRAVEEYKLESQYPTDNLQKRVAQLEKAKADRKRAAIADRMQAKKPKGSGGQGVGTGIGATHIGAARTPGSITGVADNRSLFRPSDRGQYGVAGIQSYGLAGAGGYDRRTQAGYGSIYGAGNRSPVPLSSSYHYPTDGIGSSMYGTPSYTNPSASYGGYQYNSALPQSTYQPFIR